VQRWLKFVKYFDQFNIKPYVYTPDISNIHQVDESLTSDIPESAVIIKRPIFLFYSLLKLFSSNYYNKYNRGLIPSKKNLTLIDKILLYVRGNFFIPDPKIFWTNRSLNFIKEYMALNDIDTIITTGPPHSMHLLGQKIKNSTNVKWIADFRDPWTNIWYHKKFYFSKSTLAKHKLLEIGVLNDADHVVVTSNTLNEEYSNLTKTSISTITNGFDYSNDNEVVLDKKFTISHIGSILSDRNHEMLWRVLSKVLKEVKGLKDSFSLNLIGNVSDEVRHSVKEFSLDNYVKYIGHIPYSDTNKYLKKSQILLLIQTNRDESNSIIPAKLFEYLNSNRPIVSISNNKDVKSIIEETEVGYNFNYNEEVELFNCLSSSYAKFIDNTLKISPNNINKYSRFELTRSISDIISKL
jgi:glycosyltransferase involved in cell wall biosynthesis